MLACVGADHQVGLSASADFAKAFSSSKWLLFRWLLPAVSIRIRSLSESSLMASALVGGIYDQNGYIQDLRVGFKLLHRGDPVCVGSNEPDFLLPVQGEIRRYLRKGRGLAHLVGPMNITTCGRPSDLSLMVSGSPRRTVMTLAARDSASSGF